MLKRIFSKLWNRYRSDPQFVYKFVLITLSLGVMSKAIFVAVVDHASVDARYGQFASTAPMMVMTFWSHKYLWGHRDAKLLSHLGGHWSKNFWTQFAIGHGTLTFLTVYTGLLTWHFVIISTVIGVLFAICTFAYNEWVVFKKHKLEAE